jgi:DNA-binding CsgD family transcriptional regulator
MTISLLSAAYVIMLKNTPFLDLNRMLELHALWEDVAAFSVADSTSALRQLLVRLCEMIGASDATWFAMNQYDVSKVRSMMLPFQAITSEMDGWMPSATFCLGPEKTQESEIERWFMYAKKEGIDPMVNFIFTRSGHTRSCIRHDVMTDSEWDDHWYSQKFLAFYGVGERMMMTVPVNEHCESYFMIDRPIGAPAFTTDDKYLFHHVLAGIPQLHKLLCMERGVIGLSEPLTGRESETYRLLLTPLSEKEIAEEMKLSVHTVHDYARRLYQKLGVKGRVGLMSMLLGYDTLDPTIHEKSS